MSIAEIVQPEYIQINNELRLRKYDGGYIPIGDVTFSQEDMPIVIGDKAYRGKGIGEKGNRYRLKLDLIKKWTSCLLL